VGDTLFNARIGMANEEVSQAANYLAVASAYPLNQTTHIGAGLAYSGVSNIGKSPANGNTMQVELYARLDLTDQLQITLPCN